MDEIIIQITRTLACLPRLRMLSRLAQQGELAPTRLAHELKMPLDMVSTHLRRLTSAGLIQRRRSGVWSYCVPRSPYGTQTLSGRLSPWLINMLKNPSHALENCRVGQLCNNINDPQARLHALIFEAVTAFTNVRRLQLLRRLASGETLPAAILSATLRMSEAAVSRHMGKLRRRGYIEVVKKGRDVGYKLAARGKSRLHARLLALIRAEWQDG